MRGSRVFLCLAVGSAAVSAQTLKPGLWEINNKMGGNPQMEQAMAEMQKQMASMSPEQRKQMESMMAQRGMQMPTATGSGMSMQICLTKEQVERDQMPMEKTDCKITSQTRSGKTMKMAFSCPNPPSSGEGQYTYESPEAYTSHMTVKSMVNGKPETMTMDGSGRWVKSDCGTVKPFTPPNK